MPALTDFSFPLSHMLSQSDSFGCQIASDRNQTQTPLSEKGHLFDHALEPGSCRKELASGIPESQKVLSVASSGSLLPLCFATRF